MRRYLGIIVTIVIVLAVLVGLNALSFVKLEPPAENERKPLRSSYNAGPTGTRAFYQLLEESGYQVTRWRENPTGVGCGSGVIARGIRRCICSGRRARATGKTCSSRLQ